MAHLQFTSRVSTCQQNLWSSLEFASMTGEPFGRSCPGSTPKWQGVLVLTYNMILNLLRVETLKVEEMIKRSFSENTSQQLLPDQQKKILEVRTGALELPNILILLFRMRRLYQHCQNSSVTSAWRTSTNTMTFLPGLWTSTNNY